MTVKSDISIVWFKRDLRVHDHRPLFEAATRGAVIPLYIVEPDYWQLADTSGRQWLFIRECLESLQTQLSQLGAPLIIKTGSAPDVLKTILKQTGARQIFSHEETGNGWTFARDKAVAAMTKNAGVKWTEHPQFGVTRGPTNRDKWAKSWDGFMALPKWPTPEQLEPAVGVTSEGLPSQSELGLSDICPQRQKGGRDYAVATLESFLTERGQNYRRAMSSPLTAQNECSRISTFLSTGTLSMRECAQALWTRQRELKARNNDGEALGMWRGSMSSFNGRLHWHCHFMQKLEDEPSLQIRAIHPFYDVPRDDPQNDAEAQARLWAWSQGQTGFPFVDACMRSLNATGWINFRMRAMLMAVSSYHLWLDWRAAGNVYAQKFTDYEPGIHWPQVQMQSGTTGINTVRIYNPVKQGHDQDPKGIFTRHWVPELGDVPDQYLQEPWKWDQAGSIIPSLYPARIVDHMQAARDAKDAVYKLRRKDGHREIAKVIANKHGSRRQNDRTRTRKAKPRARPKPSAQLSLF